LDSRWLEERKGDEVLVQEVEMVGSVSRGWRRHWEIWIYVGM